MNFICLPLKVLMSDLVATAAFYTLVFMFFSVHGILNILLRNHLSNFPI